MTSLQHRTICRTVGWLLALPLLSCSELESRCERNPQWCKPFELLPISEPLNLLDPDHPISVRLATPDATPELTANSAYRVFVEQNDKESVLPVVRLMTMLPSPEKIEAGWLLRPKDLVPLAESVSQPPLRCGSAKLTMYARRYQTSTGTPLVPGDPDSANYVQHGTTDLQVVREPVTWIQQAVDVSSAGWTVTGLDLGPPSLGSGLRDVLYATVQDLTTVPTRIAKVYSGQFPSLVERSQRQLAGVEPLGNLALDFPSSATAGEWRFCTTSTLDSANCTPATGELNFSNAPPKSLAVDAQGKWLVSVDASGTLRIQGYSYAPATKTFQVLTPVLKMSSPMYRQAVVGDLDLDGDADVLAWGDSPLVLLQGTGSFSPPPADSAPVKVFLTALMQLAKDPGSVIAISREPCDRRPRLLVAADKTVKTYVIGPDWSLGEPETVVMVSDPITALLRRDTDGNGIADRLIVATKPASGLPTILEYKLAP